MGASELGLQEFDSRHGFERHKDFRDLNDTVGVQCEFLSLLYDRAGARALADDDIGAVAYLAEAERFLATYPRRWITPFLRDIEHAARDRGTNPVYAHLARMLWLAVEAALEGSDVRLEAAAAQFPQGSSRGIGALTADDLAEIAYCLERDGLAWDHVAKNDAWSDAAFAERRARAGTGAAEAGDAAR
jgi:hypothetical protein